MVWPEGDPEKLFFAKLSLDKKVSEVVRTIPKGEVAHSVGITTILEGMKAELPEGFIYFPEFFGLIPIGFDRGGMILRAVPSELRNDHTHWIPLFALYSRAEGISEPILAKMLRNYEGDANSFIIDKILRPFVRQWVELSIVHGIAIESHAQNVLIEVDASLIPTGKFIYRDFGGFNVDIGYRKSNIKSLPKELPEIDGLDTDYLQEHHFKAIRQSLAQSGSMW